MTLPNNFLYEGSKRGESGGPDTKTVESVFVILNRLSLQTPDQNVRNFKYGEKENFELLKRNFILYKGKKDKVTSVEKKKEGQNVEGVS